MNFFDALKKSVCAIVFTLVVTSMQAQITGKVTGSDSNEPLIGASVVVKGTTNGTVTDVDGSFSVNAKAGDSLQVSFLGYDTQTIAVDNSTVLSIQLASSSSVLTEVVATAFNLKKAKASLGYAVQDLKGADLTKAREPNTVNSLVGKISGLRVGASAELLGAPNITLRGQAPLYVVDGVPVTTDTWNLNSDDIDEITVLKGPNAAALYGSRGKNGAIQISTKKGSKDSRGYSLEFNSSTMVENGFLTKTNVQDQFGAGEYGAYSFKDGRGNGINDADYDIWGPEFKGQLIPQYDSPVDANGVRQGTPWIARGAKNLERFIQPGVVSTNNLAISGGNERFDYRVSGSQTYQRGLLPNTDLNTTNLNLFAGLNISKQIRMEASVNYSRQYSKNYPDVNYGPNSLLYNMLIWGGADYDVEQLKNYWQPGKEGIQQIYAEYFRYNNPYFMAYEWLRGHNKNDLMGYLKFNYKISDHLNAFVRTQISSYDILRTEKMPYSATSYSREEAKGDYREDFRKLFDSNTDGFITYDGKLGDFGYVVSGGASLRNFYYNSTFATTDYLSVPGIYNFANSLRSVQVANFDADMTVQSFYAAADLNYKTYAFLNLTGRQDKNSSLLPANNKFFYPSASLSVVPSEIIDMSGAGISFLKLRASYAYVGGGFTQDKISRATNSSINSIIGYGAAYETPYGGPNYLLPTYNVSKPYNQIPASQAPTQILDSNLKPDFSSSLEIGGEVRFLNNRLGFDVSYFNSIDGPGIFSLPIPSSSGNTSLTTNGIKFKRTGYEVTMNADIVKNKGGLNWTSTINWFKWKKTLNEISPDYPDVTTYATNFKVGDRIDKWYGTAFLRDPQGNIIYSANGSPRTVGNQYLGNSNPDWEWSAINKLSYKNFSLSFQFDGRVGGVIGDYVWAKLLQGGRASETAEGAWLDARRQDALRDANGQPIKSYVGTGVVVTAGTIKLDANNQITNYGELTFAQNTTKSTIQDWINNYYGSNSEAIKISASYVKLREVTLTYNFPREIFKNTFIKGINVSLVGRNLLYWAERTDIDIDQFSGFFDANGGRSNLQTPTTRRYGFNLNVNF